MATSVAISRYEFAPSDKEEAATIFVPEMATHPGFSPEEFVLPDIDS